MIPEIKKIVIGHFIFTVIILENRTPIKVPKKDATAGETLPTDR